MWKSTLSIPVLALALAIAACSDQGQSASQASAAAGPNPALPNYTSMPKAASNPSLAQAPQAPDPMDPEAAYDQKQFNP